MKVTRITVALIGVIALVAASSAVFAYRGGPGGGPGGGYGLGQRGAELTAEQQKQFRDYRLEMLKKTQPMRSEIEKKRLELLELANKPNPDEQALQAKREEIWALKDKLRAERRELNTKFRQSLPADQRAGLCPFGGMGLGGGGCGRGKGWGRGAGKGFGPGACPGGGCGRWR